MYHSDKGVCVLVNYCDPFYSSSPITTTLIHQAQCLLPLAVGALKQAGFKLPGQGARMHDRLLIGLSASPHKEPEESGPKVKLALKLRQSTVLVCTPNPQVALQALQ